jgi:hypothetical protein
MEPHETIREAFRTFRLPVRIAGITMRASDARQRRVRSTPDVLFRAGFATSGARFFSCALRYHERFRNA